MSIDYLIYKKDKLDKKIEYADWHMSIEGYLINNFNFFVEEFKIPKLPIILGNTFDNDILKIYEYDKEEYDDRYEFWNFNGHEIFNKFRDMVDRN